MVYYFYDAPWILPVAGFLVGYITNWLALLLIFNPAEPVYVGPFRFQGVFLKRQAEVSEKLGQVSQQYFLQVKGRAGGGAL